MLCQRTLPQRLDILSGESRIITDDVITVINWSKRNVNYMIRYTMIIPCIKGIAANTGMENCNDKPHSETAGLYLVQPVRMVKRSEPAAAVPLYSMQHSCSRRINSTQLMSCSTSSKHLQKSMTSGAMPRVQAAGIYKGRIRQRRLITMWWRLSYRNIGGSKEHSGIV